MIRQPIPSSSIQSIGYDLQAGVLEVEFKNGGVYRYFGVPESIYRGLMTASSQGAWFQRRIRDTYPCEKVEDED